MRRVAVALVHHPVLDRAGQVVTTAITNIDLHDISRSAHTYGISEVFIVHPIAAQRTLAERVKEHWVSGSGGRRIPDRIAPMRCLRILNSVEEAIQALGEGTELWATSAQDRSRTISYPDGRQRLLEDGPPVLLLFGTGWGLAEELLRDAAVQLEPIRSPRDDGYNHLSVRAAAAISFDRLLARR